VRHPAPDLTYLYPDNLHIGHIGVFAGDWAWTGDPPRIPVGFVGVVIDHFFQTMKIIYSDVSKAGRTFFLPSCGNRQRRSGLGLDWSTSAGRR
jgi:hypothetical protein